MKDLALITDLYELTMAACYHDHQMSDRAAFSLFIREHQPRQDHVQDAVASRSQEAIP